MVLEHVAQNAGFLVVLATPFDTHRFGGGDLHVRDVVAIPERLEDRIRKAEYENVLDALFTEVVIDAIDLVLTEFVEDEPVERARRLEVASERLLDHYPDPRTLSVRMRALGESALA